jgi:signal transduction histidine kinase
MIFDLQTFLRLIKKGDYEIIGQAYPLAAVTGFLGYFVFYFTDKSQGLYENIYLRVVVAFIFIQLIFLKNNFNGIKIFVVESILAICLPLFYSYFYFATNESVTWGAGFVFCSFTYGFLTGRIVHTVTVFPMFVMIGFFLCDCFYMETSMYHFLNGITLMSLSILTAFCSSIIKLVFDSIILTNITIEDRRNRRIKEELVKDRADYNLSLEKDLNKVKKLDTVSKLTGGLMKDFDVMIKIIFEKSSELKFGYKADTDKIRRMDTVLSIVKKASLMINSIAAFAPNTYDNFKIINVNDLVNDLVRLLVETISETVFIKIEISAQNPYIYGNVEMLEQAFVNLAINASHAMPQGGVLLIKTDNQLLAKENVSDEGGNERVNICFKDTGTGMDQKTKEDIFKPFFSTKGKGKGNGLGLVMVNDAVKRHNGLITVDSAIAKGTTFRISLPVAGGEG